MDAGKGDRRNLLEHAASIAECPLRKGNSKVEYELMDIDTSDIGMQEASTRSRYPPSYSVTWEDSFEEVGKDDKNFNM